MSKAALKNKKKREAKARKQQEEQSEESSQVLIQASSVRTELSGTDSGIFSQNRALRY